MRGQIKSGGERVSAPAARRRLALLAAAARCCALDGSATMRSSSPAARGRRRAPGCAASRRGGRAPRQAWRVLMLPAAGLAAAGEHPGRRARMLADSSAACLTERRCRPPPPLHAPAFARPTTTNKEPTANQAAEPHPAACTGRMPCVPRPPPLLLLPLRHQATSSQWRRAARGAAERLAVDDARRHRPAGPTSQAR